MPLRGAWCHRARRCRPRGAVASSQQLAAFLTLHLALITARSCVAALVERRFGGLGAMVRAPRSPPLSLRALTRFAVRTVRRGGWQRVRSQLPRVSCLFHRQGVHAAQRCAQRCSHCASLPALQPDLENGDKGTRGSRGRLRRTHGAQARLPRSTPESDTRGRSAHSCAAALGAGSTECAFAQASRPRQLLTRSFCRHARSVAAHRVPDAL